MTQLLYAEMKLKDKEKFLELCRGKVGLPLTRSMPGFISAETAISEDKSGQSTFHLWEKWENMSDFENYMAHPNRDMESDFMKGWVGSMDDPPRMIFPDFVTI